MEERELTLLDEGTRQWAEKLGPDKTDFVAGRRYSLDKCTGLGGNVHQSNERPVTRSGTEVQQMNNSVEPNHF